MAHTPNFSDFRSRDEILIHRHQGAAHPDGRSTFTVFWLDRYDIKQQQRTDRLGTYIHRVTRNSKRPHRLI
ncbi:hypothetical protein [Nocardia farcinica]|uniref:hypothetical protein n=1 Tax=Nocardia farcinica TaxID=37329 RepID=UPI002456020F|nr:hypothetical protein [Nocardia farcinica]